MSAQATEPMSFTRQQLAQMRPEEFARLEPAINAALRDGRIR